MSYRVALLSGGASPEREVALRGGEAVERALKAR
ncbi:MAG: D-alanine--D-alanine ligase, partial [Thermodesulfatator sp.]